MNKLNKVIKNPWLLYLVAAEKGMTDYLNDEQHLKYMYRACMGEPLNLDKPVGFNEKMQWLKLHDRNPLYTTLVDKYKAKTWVADRIGAEHVSKTYAVWDNASSIDITNLPDKFVLKTNHDCGGIVICSDRSTFDLDAAKNKLSKHLDINYFWRTREWPYKDVKPCIFAEEYLDPGKNQDLFDYKLFRFSNGRIITLLMTDRFTESGPSKTFFDEDWNPLSISEGNHSRKNNIEQPPHFKEMIRFANELACDFPFMRVDFYDVNGKLYFGELTLYPNSGFEHFNPAEWDDRFGSWINLDLAYERKCSGVV